MKFLIIIILLTTSLFSNELIVVNKNNNDILGKSDIKKIYLGKKKWWANKRKITILSFYSGEIGESFSENFLSKGLTEVVIYWKQLMFTGRSSMPKKITSEADMINKIEANGNAIGYISENMPDSLLNKVKVIKLD